ncbi:Fic family protein [Nautilia sp.]
MDYVKKIEKLLEHFKYSTKLAEALDVSRMSILNWRDGGNISNENKFKIDVLYNKYIYIPNLKKDEVEKYIKKVLSYDDKKLLGSIDLIEEVSKIQAYGSYEIEVINANKEEFERVIEGNYVQKDIEKRKFLEMNNLAFLTKKIIKDTIEGKITKLTTDLIKNWHFVLFSGIRDDAGEYSKYIRKIKNSDITLTLPEDIEEEMEYWVKLYSNVNNIYDIAKAHEHFELIHPFGDGNGRIGRLIMVHQFVKLNILPPLINNQNKSLYYITLEKAQKEGDILTLSFFLASAIEEMRKRLV